MKTRFKNFLIFLEEHRIIVLLGIWQSISASFLVCFTHYLITESEYYWWLGGIACMCSFYSWYWVNKLYMKSFYLEKENEELARTLPLLKRLYDEDRKNRKNLEEYEKHLL